MPDIPQYAPANFTDIKTSVTLNTPILSLRDGEALIEYAKTHKIDSPNFIIDTQATKRFLPHFKKLLKAALDNNEFQATGFDARPIY